MMPTEEIAVLSDIHGNLWALEAVLDHIEGRGIDKIVNLGDSIYGPLEPKKTAQLLIERDIPSVSGNEDRMIVDSNAPLSPTLDFVRRVTNDSVASWLVACPATLKMGDIFMFHGTPSSDSEYLLEEVTKDVVRLRCHTEILGRLESIESRIVLCGHSHVPHVVALSDQRLVINPGSVGLQAYTDDVPYPHEMETGSPHARYSILSITKRKTTVDNLVVPYDWQSASVTAEKNGREDWAQWLRTGRAKSC
jgi:putative phosphoesterase